MTILLQAPATDWHSLSNGECSPAIQSRAFAATRFEERRSALARIESAAQDRPVKTACLLAALTASLVQLPDAATGQVVEPVEIAGRCRSSGIGQAFLNSHQAQTLPGPQCDLAVAIGDASVSFFRSGDRTPQILFSGRATSVRTFDVEIVRIGDGPVRDVIVG